MKTRIGNIGNLRRRAAYLQVLEYASANARLGGALAALPAQLSSIVDFDNLRLDEAVSAKRATLWFRHGARRVFHIRLIRKGSRHLVEMGGLDPGEVLRCVAVCRNHFDAWFGISPSDIRDYQRHTHGTGRPE